MRHFDPAPDLRSLLSRISKSPLGEAGNPESSKALPFSRPHLVLRAGFILSAVMLATVLRLWIGTRFGVAPPYITYFPAVLIIASLFGIADGIFATLLSAFCVAHFFLPGPALWVDSIGDRVGIGFFLFAGISVSIVAGALRSRTWRMHQALEDLHATERRFFAEKHRLFETSLRMATIVESAEEAIIGMDTCGVVTSWNKGAETIFGYSAQEMIGRPIHRLLPSGHESEEDEILLRVLAGEQVAISEALRMAKDAHQVHVSLHVSPIRDQEGKIVGASKVAHDITETLKLQRQLQQSQKMEAIGQLAGGIAHDFNNLLAIVLGALELQQTLIADHPEALKRWNVAHRAAKRGAELTRRLLAFSSVGHFKSAAADLNHSIRNTVEMAARLLGPEIRVELKLQSALPDILVDRSGLESAVLNMIVNSRDAMMAKGGGQLTISTRATELDQSFAATLTGTIKPGAYACISITDTGCGMPSEVLDRACEPFFTTKERGRGTGLGLSMVYGFVKHSAGGIRIYSEPGYGTTITIYLPFDTSAAGSPRPLGESNMETSHSGTLLIVDDETELLDISATYLTAQGYTVYIAEGAEAALRIIAERGPIDVMVTDIVMGGAMDGVELARVVVRSSPSTRVIYSSGFPADALSERNLPLADALVLQKPYRLSELGDSIDRAFALRDHPAQADSIRA